MDGADPTIPDESVEGAGPPAYVFSDDDDETGLTPARAAATLVVFHEQSDGTPPRLLMVERSKAMAFAAGAAVFPGGRVDDDDHMLAERHGDGFDSRDAAARVAAIRETIEETGLALGLTGDVGDSVVGAVRAGLLEGGLFSAMLETHALRLDLHALVPFARWRPNFAHARVFDARFYLARVAGAAPELTVDATENSALFWATAADVLARADAGALDIIFPTRRNLERLASFASYDEAVVSARRFPPRRITPWVEMRDGVRHLRLRDDCGYPITSEAFDSAMRG